MKPPGAPQHLDLLVRPSLSYIQEPLFKDKECQNPNEPSIVLHFPSALLLTLISLVGGQVHSYHKRRLWLADLPLLGKNSFYRGLKGRNSSKMNRSTGTRCKRPKGLAMNGQ